MSDFFAGSGGGFDASGARLRAADARIAAVVDDARRAVAAITAAAADVLAGWVGPAGAVYAGGFERWQDGAHTVIAALAESAAGLRRAAGDYDTAESAGRTAVLEAAR